MKLNKIIGIIFVGLLLGVSFLLSLKNGVWVDEVFSVAHAHSNRGAYIGQHIDSTFLDKNNELHGVWLQGDVFYQWLYGALSQDFSIAHIYHNLKKDVHPPVYFVLFYSLNKVFYNLVDVITIGLLFNLVLYALLLWVVYCVIKNMFDRYMVVLLLVLVGSLPVVLEMTCFVRMYLLEMLLILCVIYYGMKNNKSGVDCLLIFLFGLLSVLTHFYGLIYLFFIIGGMSGYLIVGQKKYRDGVCLMEIGLFVVVASFVMYPEQVNVLVYSSRGGDARQYISLIDAKILIEYAFYWAEELTKSIIGFGGAFSFVFVLLSCVAVYKKNSKLSMPLVMVFYACLLSSFFICLVSPNMGRYGARYISGGAVVVGIVWFYLVVQTFYDKWGVKVTSVLVICLSLFNFYQAKNGVFMFRDNDDVPVGKMVEGKNVVLLRDKMLDIYALAPILMKAKGIYILQRDDKDIDAVLVNVSNGLVLRNVGMYKKYIHHPMFFGDTVKYKDMYIVGDRVFDIYEL